ncbi:MAG: hypothetical protein MUC89_12650 [Acetobacteraceae bacterium]|jgi:hypothetical protein|nr:hypothetical protein [Acetobacteraceae bacterium]
MDTFDQRRSLSLVLGIAALGFAFLVSYVDEQRATQPPVPVEASAYPAGSG